MNSIYFSILYKNTLAALVLITLTTSCKKNISLQTNNSSIIDISDVSKSKTKINLSSIASKIEYVQLEGDTSCYLGNIHKPHRDIRFFQDKI